MGQPPQGSQEDVEREIAARKIQSIARKRNKAKRRADGLGKMVKADDSPNSPKTKSSKSEKPQKVGDSSIPATAKEASPSPDQATKDDAAVKLQAQLRGRKDRKKVEAVREHKKQGAAATAIQSKFRQKKALKTKEEKLQEIRAQREKLEAEHVKKLEREKKEQAEKAAAALRMQKQEEDKMAKE